MALPKANDPGPPLLPSALRPPPKDAAGFARHVLSSLPKSEADPRPQVMPAPKPPTLLERAERATQHLENFGFGAVAFFPEGAVSLGHELAKGGNALGTLVEANAAAAPVGGLHNSIGLGMVAGRDAFVRVVDVLSPTQPVPEDRIGSLAERPRFHSSVPGTELVVRRDGANSLLQDSIRRLQALPGGHRDRMADSAGADLEFLRALFADVPSAWRNLPDGRREVDLMMARRFQGYPLAPTEFADFDIAAAQRALDEAPWLRAKLELPADLMPEMLADWMARNRPGHEGTASPSSD